MHPVGLFFSSSLLFLAFSLVSHFSTTIALFYLLIPYAYWVTRHSPGCGDGYSVSTNSPPPLFIFFIFMYISSVPLPTNICGYYFFLTMTKLDLYCHGSVSESVQRQPSSRTIKTMSGRSFHLHTAYADACF